MDSDVLTAQEAASYLRLCPDSIKRKARASELPAFKVGRQWRFRKADLDEWIARGGTRYEELVDRGLIDAVREATASGKATVSLDEARKRLGLS
jgi:excisionase family DNA binding protein